MSIDKDPEVYKLLVGAVMALLGILNLVGVNILSNVKKSIETLFNRVNGTDKTLTTAVAEILHLKDGMREMKEQCKENHRRQ